MMRMDVEVMIVMPGLMVDVGTWSRGREMPDDREKTGVFAFFSGPLFRSIFCVCLRCENGEMKGMDMSRNSDEVEETGRLGTGGKRQRHNGAGDPPSGRRGKRVEIRGSVAEGAGRHVDGDAVCVFFIFLFYFLLFLIRWLVEVV